MPKPSKDFQDVIVYWRDGGAQPATVYRVNNGGLTNAYGNVGSTGERWRVADGCLWIERAEGVRAIPLSGIREILVES